jgi:hypothetical protein
LVPLLHQTYQRRGKMHSSRFTFSTFLLCFEPLHLLIYSSYILHSRLRTTQQMISLTTSSIATEVARSAAILCTTPEEEARLTVILGITKCRCLHVFTLDLWSYGCSLWTCDLWSSVVYGSWLWMNVLDIVIFEWMCCILWYLNECVAYCDIWMNVYIVCDYVIPTVLVILFCVKKIQTRLTYNGWVGRCK